MATNDPILEQVVWDKVNNLKEFFTQTKLYEAVELHFSKLGHTHTKSQITDFSHTHDDRYYTKSEINSSLANKQDSIPNYHIVHSQTEKNFIVNVYSDGLNVYVSFRSNGSTELVSGVNTMMTLSCDAAYKPKHTMSVAILRSSASSPRLRLSAQGTVQIYTNAAETRTDLNAGIMYPLIGRVP